MITGSNFMTIRDLAAFFNVSVTTIREWMKQPGFPKRLEFSKRTVRFRRNEIEEWTDGKRFTP